MNANEIILYLGYVGFENIGDEVCLESFKQQLSKRSSKKYKIIVYDLLKKPSIAAINNTTPIDKVVLGGGSLFQGNVFVNILEEVISLKIPIWTFGTGIDYLPEKHCLLTTNLQLQLEKGHMFDGKEINYSAIKSILKNSKYIGVRGPLTYQFLSDIYGGSNSIKIIGDPCLGYRPKIDRKFLKEFRKKYELNKKYVAVNWGSSLNSIFGHNEEDVMAQVSMGIKYLIDIGYKIIIFPMWADDISQCKKLYNLIDNSRNCALLTNVYSIDRVCTILEKAEFSINFKLHANILSTIMSTPFISLAYRSKCFDFASSINSSEYCLSTNSKKIFPFIVEKEQIISKNKRKDSKKKRKYCKKYYCKQSKFFKHFNNFVK